MKKTKRPRIKVKKQPSLADELKKTKAKTLIPVRNAAGVIEYIKPSL